MLGIVLVLLSAVCWSTSGFAVKLVDWSALPLAGWRGGVGALCIYLFIRATGRRVAVNRRSVVLGCVICFTNMMFMVSNKLTTAANAIVLQYTAPIFLIVISALVLKKKYFRRDYLAVFITVIGIALFFCDELTTGGLWGNILAVVDGLSLSCMYMITGEYDEELRLSGICLGATFTFIIGAPFIFFVPTNVTGISILAVLLMGSLQVALPYMLYSKAVKYCPPLACSLLGSFEIILSPLWAYLFVGELPGIWAVGGAIVIVSTLVIWTLVNAKYDAKAKTEPAYQATEPNQGGSAE